MQRIEGADALEAACGARYRLEVSDKGLGVAERDMQSRLRLWGYEATQEACRNWLMRYRMEYSAKHGTVALYKLYRHDLQSWYHVKQLGPTTLQA